MIEGIFPHDILSHLVTLEMPFLDALAWDLDGTLRMIAFAGFDKDLQYIQESQEYMKETYGNGLIHTISDVAVFKIIPAFQALQDILDGNHTPDKIRQAAEEAIDEFLTPGEPIDTYIEAFQGF